MPPKKRLSKKNKSDWRKNVDISKEEEALAAARREQIHGGAPEQKKDSDLFFEDRAQEKLTKKEAARAKALSSTVKLQSKSNVPARVSQGAPIDYAGKQVHKLAKKLEAGVPLGPKNQKAPSFVKATSHDPWAEPEAESSSEENDWIPKPEPLKRPESMDEKPSLLPAVPAPDAAASYRPTNNAMRKLKKEVMEEKARKRAAREKLAQQFAYPPELKHLPKEMKVDTLDDHEPEEDVKPDVEEKEEEKLHFSTKLSDKERRILKRKQLKERKRLAKARKAKLGDFNERVDNMLEQIKKQEAEAEERKQAREAVKEAKKFAPLKLNPGKVPTESKAALLRKPAKRLVEALKSSDGIRDRFRSMQMRNILEPKKRIAKPKQVAGRKWVVAHGYKDD